MFAFPKLSTIFSTIADRIPATVRTGESNVQQHGGPAVLLVSRQGTPSCSCVAECDHPMLSATLLQALGWRACSAALSA